VLALRAIPSVAAGGRQHRPRRPATDNMGVTVQKLQKSYDAGITDVRFVGAGRPATASRATPAPVVSLLAGGPATLAADTFGVVPAGRRLTAERIAQRVLEARDADSESIRERAREFLIPDRLARLDQLLAAALLPSSEGSHEARARTGRGKRSASKR
jgi:hypothetical protein